jgi:hypothetical protein
LLSDESRKTCKKKKNFNFLSIFKTQIKLKFNMKRNKLTILPVLCLLFASCGNNTESKDVVTDTITVTKTDTIAVIKTDTIAVAIPIDTAAILAFYEKEHAKKKVTHNLAPKAKGEKKVLIYADPTFVSTDVIAAPTPAAQSEAPKTVVKVVHDVQMYYFIPDEAASFPGGEIAFDKYLLDNLQYPEKALYASESRTVYPTLYLDEQGNPVKVEFPGAPTVYGFQDEARRILMSTPKWNPAKIGGKAVKSKFTIPISFKIT